MGSIRAIVLSLFAILNSQVYFGLFPTPIECAYP